jgi:hypothetical protein
MKRVLLLMVTAGVYAFSCTNLQAQTTFNKLWDKTFGGPGIDHLFSGQRTSDGGFIFGGASNSGAGGDKTDPFKGGNSDFWIVKMDSLGNKQWDKAYGSADEDLLRSICQTTDGGYLLAGTNYGVGISGDKTQAGKGYDDYWIVKIDSNGNKLWDKTFGGNDSDMLYAVKQTPDGGFLLAGSSGSGISGDKTQPNRRIAGNSKDYWIIKTDANGIKQWDKTIGGTSNDGLTDIDLTSDGGYILGGFSESAIGFEKSQASKGVQDYWIVKLDAAGNLQWNKTYGGNDIDLAWAIKQTTDGGYIIGGYSLSNTTGDKSQLSIGQQDYWVLKLDASGNKVWDKTFGTNVADYLSNVVETPDGGFLLSGDTSGGINGDKTQNSKGWSDYWLIKLNAAGIKVWDHSFGGVDSEWPGELFLMPSGGFVIAGESVSGISGDKSQGCQGSTDFWIIKTGSLSTGVNEDQKSLAVSVFPNPAKGKLRIQFNNLKTGKAEVTLRDLTGREVYHKQISIFSDGSAEELNIPAAKGMYLLQLQFGNQTTTQKIILE